MKIVKAGLVAALVLISLSLTSCVSLITGTAMAATMSAGVDKTLVDKTNSNLVAVHIPLAKVPNSAMLYVSKSVPAEGGIGTYAVHVHYTSSVSMARYESLRFEIDGTKTDLAVGLPASSGDVTSAFLQGLVYDFNYTTVTGAAAGGSVVIDPTVAKTLIDAIVSGKSVVVKNYQANSTDFITYTLQPADQALFKNLQ